MKFLDNFNPKKMMSMMTGGISWRAILRYLLQFLAFLAPGLLALGIATFTFTLLANIISIPLMVIPIIGIPLASLVAIGILVTAGIVLYLMYAQYDVHRKIENIPLLQDVGDKVYEFSPIKNDEIILPDSTLDTMFNEKQRFVSIFKLEPESESEKVQLSKNEIIFIRKEAPGLLNDKNTFQDGIFSLRKHPGNFYLKETDTYSLLNDEKTLLYAITQMLFHAALPHKKEIKLKSFHLNYQKEIQEAAKDLEKCGITITLPASFSSQSTTENGHTPPLFSSQPDTMVNEQLPSSSSQSGNDQFPPSFNSHNFS